jgi:type IV pilus assembly protein PilY1
MKRLGVLVLSLWAMGSTLVLAGPTLAAVGPNLATNGDYSAAPPFVSNTVQPNVLILMDNSGSMGLRAYCGTETNSANNSTCDALFSAATTYTGLFDPMTCYTYDAANSRYDVSLVTAKTAVEAACSASEWDGNFLNWVGLRRFDAVKKAMIGASCLAARAADASCPTSGTPAKITLKAQVAFSSAACCINVATPGVPNTVGGTTGTIGRVPDAVRTAGSTPANLFFIVRGNPTPLAGFFCVDEFQIFPTSGCTSSGGSFTEQSFGIRVSAETDPIGVVQELGDKARFGLMEFKGNDGVKVLTPIGWRQSVDFTSTSPVTFNTNKAALIAAVESSFPATNTPLAESVYEGTRYIAQLNSALFPNSYVYPIAFSGSGGANFGNAGAGSLGPQERSVLTGSETCPSGYITSACGRDPYFFGSDHSPAWASPSQAVNCCKTFIMVFTDGAPTQDVGVPAALQDYAHAAHGPHCTGGTTSTTPATTCFAGNATLDTTAEQAPFLLAQHKTDYGLSGSHFLDDIAYWAHTTDLRQATVPVLNVAGHDLPGFQNATVYSFFAFGNINGREILMQAARQGGFEDQNGNNLPDLTSEYDRVNNDTGVLVPDGVPDTYFESQNVDDLRDKLLAAITSILQKAASGTSISVLATSSTGEGAIYQAYFFPTTFVNLGSSTNQVLWTGYAQGLFIDKFGNLREDYSADGCTGLPDGKLVLKHDCIVKVRLETNPLSLNFNSVVVDRFKDDGTGSGSVAGDGVADTATPFQTLSLSTGGVSNLQPLWEAGRRLALLDPPGATCEPASTWPSAGTMTQSGNACRRILTWMDLSNGGGVGGSSGTETLEFSTANVAKLCPYLGGSSVRDCNSSVAAKKTAAQDEATNIINWTRGVQVTGLRDRLFNVVDDAGATVQRVWKLGDIVHSTPVIVGAPRERFDVLYGDASYAQFFQRYKDRRNVAYVGANDGMLHAFNAGFFNATDDNPSDSVSVQVRFTTTPKQPNSNTDCGGLPCDGSVTQYAFRTDAPNLGAELWAFIPQDLLPQLRWMTTANYDHMYYVDLKPMITDARIFTPDVDHPGGWGTILIGGFRLGGSCTNCRGNKAVPRVVNADFNYDGDITDTGSDTAGSDYRVFLSSYFVLDVTNPEKEPRLLWVFRDKDLGLTTAEPAVLRVNPSTDAKTSSTNEKWYAVFGTGPTHVDGFSTQTAQLFVVDLKLGPSYGDINKTSGSSGSTTCSTSNPCIASNVNVASNAVRAFPTSISGAFMADAVTLDFNLDFRVEAIYAGSVICNGTTTSTGCTGSGPMWKGAMWRLTTNGGDPNPDTWGINTGCSGFPRCATKLLSTFAYTTPQATTCANASPCLVGPISTAPVLTADDAHNIWVFFGTGRFLALADKTNTDIQHFIGVKDCIINGGCSDQGTERNNLFNSSDVVVCSSCASGTNVSTTGSTQSFTIGFSASGGSLVNSIQNMDGWFTTFNDPTRVLLTPPQPTMTLGERNISTPTLLGGTVFFTTFTPTTEICTASGTGHLYAVFYLTGGPYTNAAIGTVPSGSQSLLQKAISLGQGIPSQMAVQIGAQGSGGAGASSIAGCAGRVTGYIQASTGVLGSLCGTPALSVWSRMVSWRDM